MLRTVTIAAIPFLGIASYAQNWCPPGATWTYDHLGFVGSQGYTVMTYTQDTVLAGLSGQVINSMTVGVNWDQEVDTMTAPVHMITSHTDDLVYIWSWSQQSWDTLYNFSSGPGDSWAPPHSTPICGGAEYGDLVQVTDSGTVVVDGMPLHYVDIHCGFNNGRIVERLGWSVGMFIAEGCWVPECQCDLRCYHDDVLDHMRPDITVCESLPDLTTGLEKPQTASPVIFPNPGTDHFALDLPMYMYLVELYDATGHLVLRQQQPGRTLINTGALVPGLFTYRVSGPSGVIVACGKWVKE